LVFASSCINLTPSGPAALTAGVKKKSNKDHCARPGYSTANMEQAQDKKVSLVVHVSLI
jgi:hypothetical protein